MNNNLLKEFNIEDNKDNNIINDYDIIKDKNLLDEQSYRRKIFN